MQSFKYIAEHNHVASDIGNTKVRVVYFFLQGGSAYIFFDYDKLVAIFIVIDNADILIDDDIRRFINFEFSNQYMLFLRNCDGLNVSDKSFKVLILEDNRITLEEEL